jgi:hypothetical protein
MLLKIEDNSWYILVNINKCLPLLFLIVIIDGDVPSPEIFSVNEQVIGSGIGHMHLLLVRTSSKK